eukprot:644162-Prymnesium_polylepis.1
MRQELKIGLERHVRILLAVLLAVLFAVLFANHGSPRVITNRRMLHHPPQNFLADGPVVSALVYAEERAQDILVGSSAWTPRDAAGNENIATQVNMLRRVREYA